LISNLIRPFSLGIRLFGNMFADEKVMQTVTTLAPPWTLFTLPNLMLPLLMVLSLFVCFVQTFVFILLSQLYLSEVSHAPHGSHADHEREEDEGMEIIAPVLT
jgi:F-type H+-transporting ATPase subunit a